MKQETDETKALLREFLPRAQAMDLFDPPKGSKVTLYVLLAMLVTAVLWATFANIDKLVTARGRLITPQSNMVVQPMEPGILKSIEVRVGQVVKAGTVLATLDPTFAVADAAQLGLREQGLLFQLERLDAELAGREPELSMEDGIMAGVQAALYEERKAAFAARLNQLEQTIVQLTASLTTNEQDQQVLSSRMESLRQLETMHSDLATRQFGSRALILETRERRLEVERDYLLAKNQRAEIESQIAAAGAEREAFIKSWRQDTMQMMSDALQQRSEISEQISKAKRRTDLVTLTTQQDAIVLDIGDISPGSVVREAEPLFVLVPLDAELEAEVEVATSDIGDILVGDKVRLKIDAYPFQKHGTLNGEVTHVSADTFTRESGMGPSYHYLTRIRLTDIRLSGADARDAHLLPGMTLSGEIITGKRSVLSYFTYPFIRVLDESLRER
ncbi:HlyD family type I secretion periplasmic adaptor subunit [Zobellella endophytica]|uniref:Membrane fusion protein (MFP) family protein n=1 Tax=Zobellella endophytica TaxID=2116700 RepID=A0A2P7RD07_9GAMM|nr:HlyD family type I secretion periplasmic adaptor subunit [Zobellella endophytica]PSJ48042.1 HlyD family type I secretion periplasmic adaptor subunit [Zobellella endophytica]